MSKNPAKKAVLPPRESAAVYEEADHGRLRSVHPKKNRDEAFFSKIRKSIGPLPESAGNEPMTTEPPAQIPGPKTTGRWIAGPWFAIFASAAVLAALAVTGSAYLVGHGMGRAAANREILGTRLRAMKPLPEKDAEALAHAMTELRDGQSASAFRQINALRRKFPKASSLAYLSALAALQNGHFTEAESLVNESLKLGERISDCLAMLSVLERRKATENPSVPSGAKNQRAEELLRAAITADAANPNPHIELANLLRQNGRQNEALAELRAAQVLFNPVDNHVVMDLTVALMNVEETPVGKLPAGSPASGDVRKLFPAAFAALRRDDSATAASLLGQCRDLLSPEIFEYMIADPALRKFANRPELRTFYQN
jgi:Flp pilus assembly protein TadD